MKFTKKIIALSSLMAMLGASTSSLQADPYPYDACCEATPCCVEDTGCGYDQCCNSSSLAPALALGAIAVVAIIAVAVQDSGGHHHHGHSH